MSGRHITIPDTRLYVDERGADGPPLLILHGGPGLDHHQFSDYLDPLAADHRLIFIDQRSHGLSDSTAPETWTLEQFASDVRSLAIALGLERYAVLGHSFGAMVALQNAVDYPGDAAVTIVSSGVPGSRFLMSHVNAELAIFEPEAVRYQVMRSWDREQSAMTHEDVESIMHDQLPFHFFDPYDPLIAEYEKATCDSLYTADVLRHFASSDYGSIEVEDRLGTIPTPVLVLAGRSDRTCSVQAAEAMAGGIRDSELIIFEESAHMTFVEETDAYIETVRNFLKRRFK